MVAKSLQRFTREGGSQSVDALRNEEIERVPGAASDFREAEPFRSARQQVSGLVELSWRDAGGFAHDGRCAAVKSPVAIAEVPAFHA